MPTDLLNQLMIAARPFYTTNDPAHDWSHICRALCYAQTIAQAEKADWETVSAAVLFHDCVKLRERIGQKDLSSTQSATMAAEILSGIEDFPKGKIEAVKKCIYEHTFSLGIKPDLLESKVMQDADRLDSTGTIAIMRIFAHCGILGGTLFSWDDPLCEEGRPPDKLSFGLDWAAARLLKVSATLNTKAARRIARRLDKNLRSILSMARGEIKKFPANKLQGWIEAGDSLHSQRKKGAA